jgi:IS30 family transposase
MSNTNTGAGRITPIKTQRQVLRMGQRGYKQVHIATLTGLCNATVRKILRRGTIQTQAQYDAARARGGKLAHSNRAKRLSRELKDQAAYIQQLESRLARIEVAAVRSD